MAALPTVRIELPKVVARFVGGPLDGLELPDDTEEVERRIDAYEGPGGDYELAPHVRMRGRKAVVNAYWRGKGRQ